jgi:hypothetical protein
MEPEDSLLSLEEPATDPYPELHAITLQLPILFSQDTSNTTFTSTPRSSNWSLLFRFSDQNLIVFISHACYMSRPSYPPWLDHLNSIWWRVQVMQPLFGDKDSWLHQFLCSNELPKQLAVSCLFTSQKHTQNNGKEVWVRLQASCPLLCSLPNLLCMESALFQAHSPIQIACWLNHTDWVVLIGCWALQNPLIDGKGIK